jgi:hypothetical protein
MFLAGSEVFYGRSRSKKVHGRLLAVQSGVEVVHILLAKSTVSVPMYIEL